MLYCKVLLSTSYFWAFLLLLSLNNRKGALFTFAVYCYCVGSIVCALFLLYYCRQTAINQRLLEIATFTIWDILTTLSAVYRGHYNQTCRGVSWAYSLNVLQLIAVCMGAKGSLNRWRTLCSCVQSRLCSCFYHDCTTVYI